MPQGKVDSSHTDEKVAVRLAALDRLVDVDRPRVLDAYAGTGQIWRTVCHMDRDVVTTGVDTRKDAPREIIRVDNRRDRHALP